MTTATLYRTSSAYVQQGSASAKSGSNPSTLKISGATSKNIYALLNFGIPAEVLSPLATITSATLSFYSSGWADAHQLAVRRNTAAWSASSVTWTNKPAVGSAVLGSDVVLPQGARYDINVLALVQAMQTAGQNYGFQVRFNNTTHSHSLRNAGTVAGMAVLVIEYSTSPQKPTALSPADNQVVSVPQPTLRVTAGQTAGQLINAIQVHVDAAHDEASPDWDSGTVVTSTPELDLSAIGGAPTLMDQPIVSDPFTRANNTSSLGTPAVGGAWSAHTGTWGINTNRAYLSSATAGAYARATVDSGDADVVVEATLHTIQADGDTGILLRAGASTGGFAVLDNRMWDVLGSSVGPVFDQTFVSGDRMRVIANGTSIKVYRQAAATGPWTKVMETTTSTYQTNTRHGLTAYGSQGNTARWDDFTVTDLFGGLGTAWRIRVRGTGNVWSDWSEWADFTYQPLGELTILEPDEPPDNTITDPSPPISWAFSAPQQAYRLFFTDPSLPPGQDVIYDSGIVTSTDQTATPNRPVVTETGHTYKVHVRVWDAYARVVVGGVTDFVEASREFTYVLTAGVNPVTTFAIEDLEPYPFVKLTWSRTEPPDGFQIVRDGVAIDVFDAVDLLISGDDYEYIDVTAPPRQEHTWIVRAIVNGEVSATNTALTTEITPVGIWLSQPEKDRFLPFITMGAQPIGLTEEGETFNILKGEYAVRIFGSQRGWSGTISGEIMATPLTVGDTGAELRDLYLTMRADQGETMILSLLDMAVKIMPFNMTIAPTPTIGRNGDYVYLASFEFIEVE